MQTGLRSAPGRQTPSTPKPEAPVSAHFQHNLLCQSGRRPDGAGVMDYTSPCTSYTSPTPTPEVPIWDQAGEDSLYSVHNKLKLAIHNRKIPDTSPKYLEINTLLNHMWVKGKNHTKYQKIL